MDRIWLITNKGDVPVLRTPTEPFDFSKYTRAQIREILKVMRVRMKLANGVGLSANQVGINERFFVAEVPDSQGKPKFYSIFNPQIIKTSKGKTETIEEGCLSVPETFGPVERFSEVTLVGQDANGKKVRIKAWGLLARVFQHEVDHLDGKLFIDRAKRVIKPKHE